MTLEKDNARLKASIARDETRVKRAERSLKDLAFREKIFAGGRRRVARSTRPTKRRQARDLATPAQLARRNGLVEAYEVLEAENRSAVEDQRRCAAEEAFARRTAEELLAKLEGHPTFGGTVRVRKHHPRTTAQMRRSVEAQQRARRHQAR